MIELYTPKFTFWNIWFRISLTDLILPYSMPLSIVVLKLKSIDVIRLSLMKPALRNDSILTLSRIKKRFIMVSSSRWWWFKQSLNAFCIDKGSLRERSQILNPHKISELIKKSWPGIFSNSTVRRYFKSTILSYSTRSSRNFKIWYLSWSSMLLSSTNC